jgi:predicted nucleotidyltransferase component of viral defense system
MIRLEKWLDQLLLAGRLSFLKEEALEGKPMKLKVEINTREHGSLLGIKEYAFAMENSWHTARVSAESFQAEELFGTKLRALLQRRKNRDLFDLYYGFRHVEMNPVSVVEAFLHYLKMEGLAISRNEAERRRREEVAIRLRAARLRRDESAYLCAGTVPA